MISPEQIKMVHVMKSVLKMDDNTYRTMLSGYGVSSSRNLSFADARDLISKLEVQAIETGVWKKRPSNTGKRFDNLAERPGMASSAQLRKIEVLWMQVSRAEGTDAKRKALSTFIRNRFGISFIEWLPMEMVGKVIKTIETMIAQSHKENENDHGNGNGEPDGAVASV